MGLRVWLPLNGNLNNKGLSGDITVTSNNGAVNADGKTGTCYSFIDRNYCQLSGSPISGLKQFSICFWTYVTSSSYSIFTAENDNAYWQFCLNNNYLRIRDASVGVTGSRTDKAFSITPNIWTHVAIVYDSGNIKMYRNGVMSDLWSVHPGTSLNAHTKFYLAGDPLNASYVGNCRLNDFRIYDHCLSGEEVHEVSKALIMHYGLDTKILPNDNLLFGSQMRSMDRANWVSSSSTDWTKFLRFYNGASNKHTFTLLSSNNQYEMNEDSILLNAAQNIGICFVRKATDIDLDPNSYYTISCEAKCTTKTNPLCIGLSYYNNDSSWRWRGGTNGTAFTAVNTWQTFSLKFKPDADTQYICYCFTVKGAANSTNRLTIRKCKLEKGSTRTEWTPSSLEYKYVYDQSGYGNDGDISVGGRYYTIDETAPRYDNTMTFYPYRFINVNPNVRVKDEITVSCWAYMDNWSNFTGDNNRIISCTQNGGWCIYSTDSKICFLPGTGISTNTYLYAYGPNLTDIASGWHHFAGTYDGHAARFYMDGNLTGTSSTTYTDKTPLFYNASAGVFIGAEAVNSLTVPSASSGMFTGSMTDFRIYATALPESDIRDLYNMSAVMDDKGNMKCLEFVENNGTALEISKVGQTKVNTIIEQCEDLITESDGAVFLRILHHNNPAANMFTAGNCWFYNDKSNLYSDLRILKDTTMFTGLSQYEFLVCEKAKSSSTETRVRWRQTSNPATATTATGFQLVSGSAERLTAGLATSDTHGCFDINGSKWWCCCGCYTQYTYNGETGIPGFTGLVVDGYMDLYVKLPDDVVKGNLDDFVKLYKKSVVANQIFEI